ncbi:MAG TPA: GNAT family N-acetyltransferase [Caulobacteraceae bacterium]|nr:GNAT family N-acetyltransferase [Caulobacteraceae bacterium]
MTLSAPEILDLETISARAWPAARTMGLGGWRLHASAGFSGRTNACWPLGDPELALDDAIARAEAWYESHGLPSLYKIVDAACAPPGLPERLAARRYRSHTETIMMTGPVAGLGDPAVILGDVVEPDFAAVFAATAHGPGDARERLETLERVPRPRAFARLYAEGSPAAIGAGAAEGDWAGVFAMRTDPRFRRQGLARRILASLMAFAAGAGANRAWLQVEAVNTGAIALYQAAGFREAYRYQYWSRPASGAPS